MIFVDKDYLLSIIILLTLIIKIIKKWSTDFFGWENV